ncbi:asparagine synthase-related protein [Streptomyces sp. NPDC046261]|uniref:asparagine synthase-related protein n=1 Tax=Streptomyces sp. NPDC046261 TaxID=3157200 RepID=UPI0033F65983
MEFVILPDHGAGEAYAGTLRDQGRHHVLRHSSGRPWIVGSWREEDIVSAARGSRRIALFGCPPAAAGPVARALERGDGIERLDDLTRSVPGSYHLVASFAGHLRVQGSLSGVRDIFFTEIGGVTLVADRPDTLAALAGRGVDETSLVCRLMSQPPWPLAERTLWQRVHSPGPGRYLLITPDGRSRTIPWWTPPPPGLPLAQAAGQVRSALDDAVAARTQGTGSLGCDLSGGMDSTTIAFLAHRHRTRGELLTTRTEAQDAANDDGTWARRAADALPDARPMVFAKDSVPGSFAGLRHHPYDHEAPYAWGRVWAELEHITRRLADRGVSDHLTGHGGDELFSPAPSFHHTLARTRPLTSVRTLWTARSMYRWPVGAMLRNLLSNPSYAQWLEASAGSLTEPVTSPRVPLPGWGTQAKLPLWATADAVATGRRLLRQAATHGPAPHSPNPAQHEFLQAVRQCGRDIRLTDRLTRRLGVAYHAPFLDDQVLEAAMSVRLEERTSPVRTKPVLAAAMRGTVPDAILDRTTKGEFSAEVYAGFRRHKRELLELCDDMRLEHLGLVDGPALRSVLLAPHPRSATLIPVVFTLACETWLRSLTTERTDSPRHSPRTGGTR